MINRIDKVSVSRKKSVYMKRIISVVLAAVLLIGAVWTAPAAKAANKKLIAITYDDGPGPYTESLLDGLKARDVKATFFMVGNRVSSYSATVARVYREGHQVANHSYDHSDLTGLSESGIRSQIQNTNNQLNKACGKGTDYMVRAPYGSVNSAVFQAVGAPLVLWSVDPLDWMYRNAETVKNNIIRNAHDGAIVLVHDIHSTSIPGSLAAIDYLKKQGYEFVTVRELFRRRGQSLNNGVQYGSCSNTGKDLGPVEAPTITTETVNGKLRVTLKAQPGAAIYYTTGSGELNQESTRYTGPFLTDYPCKLRAVAAFNMNGSRSKTVEQTITMPKAQKPQLQVSDGMLSIKCTTAGSNIYYTLTGASESGGEQVYTEPVPIEPGTEITAYAAQNGYLDSEKEYATYSARGNFLSDVHPGQWYYEPIDRAAAAGYMAGVGGGRFLPNENITRGQLVTILYSYSGETVDDAEVSSLPFTDVKSGKYYTEPVAWAYSNGIMSGCGNNMFKPEIAISRQEMAQVFYKFLYYRQAVSGSFDGSEYAGSYTDANKISGWAENAVGYVSYIGLMNGVGNGAFQPNGSSTRGQAATVLMQMADYLEGMSSEDQHVE